MMKKLLKTTLVIFLIAALLIPTCVPAIAVDADRSETQPQSVGFSMEDLAKKSTNYLQRYASNKIKDAIGKIPVVGGTVKSLFGSYIDNLLGIKKEKSTNERLDELKERLEDLFTTVDKYNQTEMKKIYELQFTSFQETLSKVKTKTNEYLDTIQSYGVSSASDDEKTVKVAALTGDSGFGTYLDNINLLSQYITDEILQLHDDGGIFTRAFKVYCDDVWREDQCALGGEAAMESSEYVNAISGIVDTAQTTAAMMLLARCNVGENVQYYKAEQSAGRVTADVSLTGFNPTDAAGYKSKYKILKGFRYDIFGATEEDVENEAEAYIEEQKLRGITVSEEAARKKVVSVKPGVVGEYNRMIEDRWFDYIDKVDFSGNVPEVTFIPMDGEIGFGTLDDFGMDLSETENYSYDDSRECCEAVTENILACKRSAIDDTHFDRLLRHIAKSEYFNYARTSEGADFKRISLKDALTLFGFSFNGLAGDEEASSKFVKMFVTKASSKATTTDSGTTFQRSISGYAEGYDYNYHTTSIIGKDYADNHMYYYGAYGSKSTKRDTSDSNFAILYFQSTKEIGSTSEFKSFISDVASGNKYAGKNVVLTADIDLTDVDYTKLWTSGDSKKEFAGFFDGGGHVIKGLKLITEENRLGLFRTTGKNAVIKNVNLVDFTVRNLTKAESCGGLVGYANGRLRVENVTLSGESSIAGCKHVGGLVGEAVKDKYATVTLKNCANYADVTSGNVNAAGLIGNCGALVLDGCVNMGNIFANNGAGGGIAGYIGTRDIDPKVVATNCKNIGTVTGYDCAGGIIGHLDSDSAGVLICANENLGDVTVTTKRSVGGIVGRNCAGGEFRDNYNSGNIVNRSQNDDAEAGGILGENQDDAITMSGNKNIGNVTGYKRAGGIAGTLGDRDHDKVCIIENNTNVGTVTSLAKDAGGIVGGLATDNGSHKVVGNTNSGTISAQSEAGGIIGWMAGGGTFDSNVNTASVVSADLNAGGIVGRIQDDRCTFINSDVGDPEVSVGSAEGLYFILARNTKQHAGSICGWDGKSNKVINSDSLLASIFGTGSPIVVIALGVLLIAAVAVFVILVSRKKKQQNN